ncbi:putative mitochondrial hypothetical protein [Leptomonas pyrrhocoris]|uniref:Uncharacterized protein n=1 Tax=Leptomonas pyrrhocoris TaxID=157538 RepID=A0A0M9FWU2_LEPPY|nr:putative mitochondrial hypothetical protein [Leptomonas pyrrhocoris]XP_015656148.1 putative mitochondrial hypothetical protein [Leptomonas pyrrhocoris]XP_015656149.1 putative mitochondrial hypothetical protein [Leptomonas pyrrhocoris]KPA77708.1 putative mitochondrial hypothetical protein [Leptomonas pyrrhocoris]KPA77709.1 putative mitochondrial hypothetical protein [Leptomonas pyrrhocoris]KPA77710.1 putative mitochondrial hypothetical protein [Leptomonas pyrrhocoris]|eukprot:XP_015656147.1 putative mitochondrial hypothetical protein [Leptomonas pyrrhocoris]
MQVPKSSSAADQEASEAAAVAPLRLVRDAAVETPFITDPAEVAALDIPVEYVRRMEEAQRIYGNHHMQHQMFGNARNHAAMTVGFQCCWLGIAAWVVSRGLRYSDPINSVVARWVQNSTVRRLTTPISCLGLVIFSVTCTQLPYDVKVLREAEAGMAAQKALMAATIDERQLAYRDGKLAKEKLEAKEAAAFTTGMKQQP